MQPRAASGWALSLFLGAAAGSLVAWLVWKIADRRLNATLESGGLALSSKIVEARGALLTEAQSAAGRIDQEISAAVERHVVPAVRQEVRAQLQAANITPAFIADLRAALSRARSLGLL